MQAAPRINVLVEGDVDEVVVRRILVFVGVECGPIYGKQGKQYLLERLPNYNKAARFSPWLVIVDLDQDAACAPQIIQSWLPQPASNLHLRVAVRAVEAWLLADAERFAAVLRVPVSRFPRTPDDDINPKQTIVNIARESRKRSIREDVVPRQRSSRQVGPGYLGIITEFVMTPAGWRPEVAMLHSDSLRRCIEALQAWKVYQSG